VRAQRDTIHLRSILASPPRTMRAQMTSPNRLPREHKEIEPAPGGEALLERTVLGHEDQDEIDYLPDLVRDAEQPGDYLSGLRAVVANTKQDKPLLIWLARGGGRPPRGAHSVWIGIGLRVIIVA